MTALTERDSACSPSAPSASYAQQRGFRSSRLRQLGFGSYLVYLRSPVWKAIRAEYLASERPQACVYCGDPRFVIHHLTYRRVGGDELMSDLVAMCSDCHGLVHSLERRRLVALEASADLADARRAVDQAARAAVLGHLRDQDRAAKLALFQALPVHRRVAAICAYGHRYHQGPALALRLLKPARHCMQRAVAQMEKGKYPEVSLRGVDKHIEAAVGALERRSHSGPSVVDELLVLA